MTGGLASPLAGSRGRAGGDIARPEMDGPRGALSVTDMVSSSSQGWRSEGVVRKAGSVLGGPKPQAVQDGRDGWGAKFQGCAQVLQVNPPLFPRQEA